MIPTFLVYNTCACVYIYILVYAYAVINRDDLVRGVNTRSLLTDFGCNRRRMLHMLIRRVWKSKRPALSGLLS